MEPKLFLGKYLIWVILLLGQLHGYKSCTEKEKKALLELQKHFDYVLPTWINDTKSDCYRWKDVECNCTSGRVIGLSFGEINWRESSFLNLSLLHPFEELQSMNFSGQFELRGFFDDVEGYKSLRSLRNLEIMDLSSTGVDYNIFPFLNAATSLTALFLRDNKHMNGLFPIKELRDLTNLKLLKWSINEFEGSVPARWIQELSINVDLSSLQALKHLEHLDLSGNILNGSIPELKDLTNLELLDLSQNNFSGSMLGLIHLQKLKALDLSYNYLSSSNGFQELIKNLTSLEVLGLAGNSLRGPIPIAVCDMKNLRELDLRGNHFIGQLPLCLGSLNKLRVLDLSSNQLSGNLPSSFSTLKSLEYLSLSDNNFTRLFSLTPLTNLTKVKVLKLSSTPHMLQAEVWSSWKPEFQLSVVVLRSCNLEKIPSFLVHQKNLHLVDLSNNRLSGNIPTWLLANNRELEVLQLQNNSFTIFQMSTIVHNLKVLDFSANDIGGMFPDNIGRALPNLVHMNCSDNGFQGQLPLSIGEMKNISFMDLSYNNFSGKLPRSFLTGCVSLRNLRLSHNKFSGRFLPRGTSFTSMEVLRVDNNLFSGKIGVGLLNSTELFTLDMSNNCLTGAIPSWISKLYHLDSLLVSNNFLVGTIAHFLVDMPQLSFLDISGNLLSGALPSSFSFCEVLFLHNNNFTGPIPETLLEYVKILDLRNNKLSGSMPQFGVAHTFELSILLLRGNNLTGSIPRKLCDLSTIRLLDLSDNKLSGFIPSCLYNLSFGRGGEEFFYNTGAPSQASLHLEFYKSTFAVEKLEVNYIYFQEIEIRFGVKQRYDPYFEDIDLNSIKGTLDYMYGMDLSNNELSGVIPAELGNLPKIKALNLSHNFLSSSIPSSFSNLKDIESLDLSYNMLHGIIPYELTNLTSLEVFDVSHNNLSGIIPQGKQFNTFNESSYLGNPFLCGPSINISCEAKKSSEGANSGREEDDDEDSIDMLVFYYSAASTYVIAFIGIVVFMCFDCPWRRAWLRIVDAFIASAKSM